MKFGFITNNLVTSGMSDLMSISRWAAENGFEDLELGPSIELDVDKAQKAIEETGIHPSGLIYCRNVLDPVEGEKHIEGIKARIDFAHEIGAKRVTCSTGFNDKTVVEGNILRYDPEGCIDDVVRVFTPLLKYAEDKNVSLCFEMCPMMMNIAISPYMWEKIFEKLDSKNLGMVYDPSHLVWEMMDPYEVIYELGDKIIHVHGKDCIIDYDKLKRTGILHLAHKLDSTMNTGEGIHTYEHTWWYYRLPGLGSLDWTKIMKALRDVSYDGTISIEHEDPIYSGELDKVKQGIIMARDHIALSM
jgi:sugar phosphate isomerase/epimerase